MDLRDSRGHRADDISANFPGTGPMRPDEFCVPLYVQEYPEQGWVACCRFPPWYPTQHHPASPGSAHRKLGIR